MTGSQKQSVIGRQNTRIKRHQGTGHQNSNVARDRTSESNIIRDRTPEFKHRKGQDIRDLRHQETGHTKSNVIRRQDTLNQTSSGDRAPEFTRHQEIGHQN